MNNIIQVDNLVKQYKNTNTPSVNNLNFNVKEGEFFAFLGQNGAGKTSTISILTTTLLKNSGKVLIDGYDLDKYSNNIRASIGVLFQNPSLDLELTAEENIRLHVCNYGVYRFMPFYSMMSEEYKQNIKKLAKMIGLHDNLFKKVNTFSGGMKRKLEIIRCLMHKPKIIFLDEPTQGLDPASRRMFWEYLNKVRIENNITIFLTTHYLEEAEGADQICIIDDGRVIMSGTPSQLKNKLIDKYMYIDSNDRKALKAELQQIRADFVEISDGFKVRYSGETPQELISMLKTTLTKLHVYEATLEDAYLELINNRRKI